MVLGDLSAVFSQIPLVQGSLWVITYNLVGGGYIFPSSLFLEWSHHRSQPLLMGPINNVSPSQLNHNQENVTLKKKLIWRDLSKLKPLEKEETARSLWADGQNFKEISNWGGGRVRTFLVSFKEQEEKWGIIPKNNICLQEHRACCVIF